MPTACRNCAAASAVAPGGPRGHDGVKLLAVGAARRGASEAGVAREPRLAGGLGEHRELGVRPARQRQPLAVGCNGMRRAGSRTGSSLPQRWASRPVAREIRQGGTHEGQAAFVLRQVDARPSRSGGCGSPPRARPRRRASMRRSRCKAHRAASAGRPGHRSVRTCRRARTAASRSRADRRAARSGPCCRSTASPAAG